jgi:membrane-bound lytic murein transglycosylase B
VTAALVAVSGVVLAATLLMQAIGGSDQVPVASAVDAQDTASTTTSPAASQAPLPDPVVLAADSPARRVARAAFGRVSETVDIPDVALSAYQRAATVMNAADPDCRLDWSLVAAIGYVESNHGRYAGSRLDDEGLARPAIRGIRLDGSRDTQRIKDTDAGQYDGDERFDRAVGPMQILPSTWTLIGVDADGDDVREPQDVHDAALAAAVYLCSGSQDLSTDAGRRAAVHRYNPDDSYVDLVLEIADDYAGADVSPVGDTIDVLSTPTLDPGTTPVAARERTPGPEAGPSQETLIPEPVKPSDDRSPSSDPSSTPTTPPTSDPTTPPTTTPPTTTPPTTLSPSPSASETPSSTP